jgi:diaminohydroxyphosphoribosylaminopyrimidine deaminase/5-amino-6-(5-phosphoribosylamino)uracil reductase
MDLPEHDGKVDLQALRKELGRRGVLRTLVEGGSGLLTQLIRTGEFNCLSTYMGACMLGSNGLACIGDLGGTSITHALRLKLQQMQRLGDDVRLDYIIENSGEEPK